MKFRWPEPPKKIPSSFLGKNLYRKQRGGQGYRPCRPNLQTMFPSKIFPPTGGLISMPISSHTATSTFASSVFVIIPSPFKSYIRNVLRVHRRISSAHKWLLLSCVTNSVFPFLFRVGVWRGILWSPERTFFRVSKYKIWEEDQAISLYKDKNDCLNHNSLWKWSTQKTQDQRLWRHGVRSWRHLTKKIYSTLRKVLCAMINCINLWLPYQAMIYSKLWVIAFTNNSKPRRTFSLKRVNSLP